MTVSTTYSTLTYAGNGSVTNFAVSWQFFESASLVVTLIAADETETVQTLGTNYTVTGGTNSSGLPATGTVTMVTAPASGETLRIERNTPATQSSQWSVAGPFNETSIEAALDRAMLIAQEASASLNSATEAAASATAAAASATAAAASAAGVEDYYDLIIANYVQPGSTETYEHLALDDISSGFDGSTATHALTFATVAFTPASAAQLLVQVNGVMQKPTTDYTVVGDDITFTTAPASGDTCVIRALKTSMTAADLAFTPTGSISATNVQAAIAEAASESTLSADLASTANGDGASLVAIEDAGGLITATTVEGALAENRTAIDALEAAYAATFSEQTALIDDISGGFNGSTTAFNLEVSAVAFEPATVYNLFVLYNGVIQAPGSAFTLSGASEITFTFTPQSGDTCIIWCIQIVPV